MDAAIATLRHQGDRMKIKSIRLTLTEIIIYLYILPFLFNQPYLKFDVRSVVLVYAFLAISFIIVFISDTMNDLSAGFRIIIAMALFIASYAYFLQGELLAEPLQFVILILVSMIGVILFTIFHDITAKVDSAANRLVRSLAPANCCSYEEAEPYISYEINRSRRYGNPLTFLYITLIMPKETQDAIAMEDRAVRDLFRDQYDNQVLRIFYNTIRTTDVLIDADGSYVIMMVNSPRENAEILINRLVDNFEKESAYRVSVGIAEFPKNGIIYQDLIDSAKQHMTDYSEIADEKAD